MAAADSMSVREHFVSALTSPRAPLWAAAAALLLSLPSLFAGEFLDDHLMRAQARAGLPVWDRFSFASPDQVATLREQGSFGWWSADELTVRFFRPISALTHALDHALWPDAVWWMHLENALVYALLTWLVATLIQRVHGPGLVAGIAGLVFAIDESHAGTVYWISGRNTLLAAMFGVLALLAHLRWRDGGGRRAWPWAPLAVAALGASLLAAEAGLCSFGYLLGWSLSCERGRLSARSPCCNPSRRLAWSFRRGRCRRKLAVSRSPCCNPSRRLAWSFRRGRCRRKLAVSRYSFVSAPTPRRKSLREATRRIATRAPRLAPLLPYVAVIVIWRIAYTNAGFGASHSSIYFDVGAQPLLFVGRALVFSPALTFTSLTVPITDLIVARPWTTGVLALAGLLLLWGILPVLRADPRARAWLLGMMFAAVPFAATWPSTRLLPVLSIGGCALVGLVHQSALEGRLRRAARGLILACNLVLAPLAFVPAGLSTGLLEPPHRILAAELPEGPEPVVILNSPTEITNFYPQAIRESAGRRWAQPTYLLYVGIEPLEAVRIDARSLELYCERGWASELLDRFSRDWAEGFAVGERVGLRHAEVTVLEITADGRPRRVLVVFDRSLDEVAIYGFGRADRSGATLERWQPAPGERERFRARLVH